MAIEDIMLREISQAEKSTIRFQLYVESKNKANKQPQNRLMETETNRMVAR